MNPMNGATVLLKNGNEDFDVALSSIRPLITATKRSRGGSKHESKRVSESQPLCALRTE
jgi:hypothetical protein